MSLLQIQNLTFGYDNAVHNVFDGLTLSLDTDWRCGLAGRNGRGKTTLLKLLSGELCGSGDISASVRFEYFPYALKNPELPTLVAVGEACPGAQVWQLERELSLLGLAGSVEKPFSLLSEGQKTRALLAAMFLREGGFPLIDEPTNHLDAAGRAQLAAYLQKKPGFLLVSHDRAFLDACIDHLVVLNKTDVEVRAGSFSAWYKERLERDAAERAADARLKKEAAAFTEAARRATGWADKVEATKYNTKNSGLKPDRGYIGAKSARMMKRAKSVEARSEKAAAGRLALLKNTEEAEALKLSPLVYHSDRLVELKDISFPFCALSNFSLTLRRGERIALQGANGTGKTSLLRLILGENIPREGDVWRGGGLVLSYVSQKTDHLSGSLGDYALRFGLDKSLYFAILTKLGFARRQLEGNLEDLSGGQKKKAMLARSLCEKAHLYIWDEPLNFIDLFSRIQIEALLKEYEPTMLFVEHDAAFVQAVATRTVIL
ncbi:MAG TPA: ATP-binding cassette domain-containing protein [Candidatus Acidoferrum sp.]|nr:ATP-binding cassette domain-containing protein [Candidatus Acidoferrum sp.]